MNPQTRNSISFMLPASIALVTMLLNPFASPFSTPSPLDEPTIVPSRSATFISRESQASTPSVHLFNKQPSPAPHSSISPEINLAFLAASISQGDSNPAVLTKLISLHSSSTSSGVHPDALRNAQSSIDIKPLISPSTLLPLLNIARAQRDSVSSRSSITQAVSQLLSETASNDPALHHELSLAASLAAETIASDISLPPTERAQVAAQILSDSFEHQPQIRERLIANYSNSPQTTRR